MITNKILNMLMGLKKGKNNKLYNEAREAYENISATNYAEAAQKFELQLAKYLSKHKLAHQGIDDALNFYTTKYPIEKNLEAYAQKSSVESGAVGLNEEKMKEIVLMGNMREKVSMLCNFSSFVMAHKKALRDKNSKEHMLSEAETYGFTDQLSEHSGVNFDRTNRVPKTQAVEPDKKNQYMRFQKLEDKKHILEDISQGLRTSREAEYFFKSNPDFTKSIGGTEAAAKHIAALKRIEEIDMILANENTTETKKIQRKLKKEKKELKLKVKSIDKKIRKRLRPGSAYWDVTSKSGNVVAFNNKSVNLVAGPSGTARTICIIAQILGLPEETNLNLRLAILSQFITERHHSFHEIMEVTNKMFGMSYTDTDKRYKHIEPLTEDELRKNVTENKNYYSGHPEWKGKFPDEIGKSISAFEEKRAKKHLK